VIRITLVFILAIFPSLVSLWLINRSQQRLSNRLRGIRYRHEYSPVMASDFLSIPLETENKPALIAPICVVRLIPPVPVKVVGSTKLKLAQCKRLELPNSSLFAILKNYRYRN